ncbi:hypothetical protein QTP70_033160 [Hemibagrus guttatus]|uniref:ribonuclease H n=1 Tax=Hemibagrus guttatus TaxID=175788 RepID=A0AAE0PX64_9TELE|nr:hypothetical protein QTP70_033160 [Hemibagrus guttatus]
MSGRCKPLTQYVLTDIRLDKLLHQHHAGARPPVSSHPRLCPDYPRPREEVPKPLQLGRSRLTKREHQRRAQMRLYYYCEGSGHLIHWCPERPSSAQVGENSLFFSLTVPVSLCLSDRCVPASALIDSGAAVNLIDRALVEELRIPTIPCMPFLRITAIDSQPIGGGHLTHQTKLLWGLSGGWPGLSSFSAGGESHGGVYRGGSGCWSHTAIHVSTSGRVFLVGKKNRGLCPCIDYRGLNAITVRYPYPLPLVPAALEQFRGAKFFTKLDLRSAYYLVRIREGDEWKTTFYTTHGHYEYLIMPFGLTNAPAVFQSLINKVFQDILGKWVIAYIDDILVYSTSLEEHVRHVRAVLSRLQQNHLYVKPEKCEFHWTTITFLGYVISRQGVEMDLTKVQAITDWPNPTTVKELQWFLGFANFYQRFIRNYRSVAGPLNSLLRGKPRRLAWTDQAQSAFLQLKDSFTTALILRHPDPDLPFVVEVDASSSGIGAVLSQQHGVPGKLHPCAFVSRKLMAAEANYDIGYRELLSVKAALEEWQHWLAGAHHPFLVLTDHRNLEYLHSAKHLNPRQARWALFFTWFQFSVTRAQEHPGPVESHRGDSASPRRRATTGKLPRNHGLSAASVPPAGVAMGARGPQLQPPGDPLVDSTHLMQVLVAIV